VPELDVTADELVSALLTLAKSEAVCILDSCGVGYLGSHLLIAGIDPVKTYEFTETTAAETLSFIDEKLAGNLASVFTISYDFGMKMLGIASRTKPLESPPEPDVFLALFDVLVVHDYETGVTCILGNGDKFHSVRDKLKANISNLNSEISHAEPAIKSNFTRAAYVEAIERVKECIRAGNTYQTNLTQQLTVPLPDGLTGEQIFARLRRDNRAPFSAFIKRLDSTVVSSSPERFFKIDHSQAHSDERSSIAGRCSITTSPIKGTRRRGQNAAENDNLKLELLNSSKDRAENIMIVDLLRNDLGRICEYGTVRVEKLCSLEEHPTLFHLVSTVTGDLRPDAAISDILKAVFPCGSITGAPKISTMQIIDEIEPSNRGLSMGAIGIYVPSPKSEMSTLNFGLGTLNSGIDLAVAIRTMVIRHDIATFNVGGGVVIDSDPESEYQETLVKAEALRKALGASLNGL